MDRVVIAMILTPFFTGFLAGLGCGIHFFDMCAGPSVIVASLCIVVIGAPCFFVLSRITRLSWHMAALAGIVAGAVYPAGAYLQVGKILPPHLLVLFGLGGLSSGLFFWIAGICGNESIPQRKVTSHATILTVFLASTLFVVLSPAFLCGGR